MLRLKTKKIDELRSNIAFYLDELSYGIKNDKRDFDHMEYINFFMLDVITSFYYSLQNVSNNKERFLSNLDEIALGLRRNKNDD